MSRFRSFVRAVVAVMSACVVLLGGAATAFAQASPTPTGSASAKVAPPGPPASYYASYGLIAIAGLVLLLVLAGFLFQAPGFRRTGRGAASPGE